MISQSEEFSLRRARLVTLVVVAVVTAAIALANLASEPVTSDWLKRYAPNKPAERAYGWPLTWYWRSAVQYVPPVQNVPKPTWGPVLIRWPVSRYHLANLNANLAIWLALLAASLIGCEWLLRRYRPRLPRRPRVLTLIVLLMVSAPMVLANLSFNFSPRKDGYLGKASYGWPLIWYWHVNRATAFSWERAWDYSARGLAANLLLWILMLAAIGLTCEWVFRRCRPRLSFSLRTMLVGVALLTVLCAWYAAARKRAVEQDAVSTLLKESGVYYERWGPKWLDLVGADRFRRRIIGVRVDQEAMNDELFERLGQLPGLRFLDVDPYLYDTPFVFTPGMAAALGEMRQLRMLSVNCLGDDSDKSFAAMDECFAAIGKLTQLERLRLSMWKKDTDDLGFLADLANLKTFILDMSEDSE